MRKSTLIWLGLAMAAGTLLFHTAQQVSDGRQRLAVLEKNTRKEEETLRVLQAEWSYLNQAERLEKLARQHLSLDSMKGRQFIRLQDLDQAQRPAAAAEAQTDVSEMATDALKAAKEAQEKVALTETKPPVAAPLVKTAPARTTPKMTLKQPSQRMPATLPKKTVEKKTAPPKQQSAQQNAKKDPRQFGDLMKSLGVR